MRQRGNAARAVADAIADRLASPAGARGLGLPQGWWPQSLAYGAAGVALLHIERARAGIASWQRAHDWLRCAAGGDVVSGDGSHLHYGAPALAFALHNAAHRPACYARALDALDGHIAAATRRRLERAHTRMDRGRLPALTEFDAIRGLSGIGAYLLHRHPDGELVRAVLTYLVRLTEPVTCGGERLPGWWSDLGPSGRPSVDFPGGHGNNGMAHGVGGPLALLSLALRRGTAVDGQIDAIGRICAWLDQWRQRCDAGPWWPYWVTRAELREGRLARPRQQRPSWCYGTAGLARAQQLAALATRDTARQCMAEQALADALSKPRQLAATADLSLCHGFAGLVHIARCAAADATGPEVGACLPDLLDAVLAGNDGDAERPAATLLRSPGGDLGLLEGAAGIALAMHNAWSDTLSISGWDRCLLIN
jgi:hypothetical protein